MRGERGLWRAVRWPLVLIGVACLGIAVATVLDRVFTNEWALTIGAPALTVLLPLGLLWLAVAVVWYVLRRRRATTPR